MKKTLISIVVPVYNEAGNINWLHEQLAGYLQGKPWESEIILVDDGSQDASREMIAEIAKKHKGVRYISFSRNFGKEAATTAGIRAAKGDAVVMIDADGQHPMEFIERFVEEWQGGAEVVVGVRMSNQNEGLVKRYGSKLFYRMLNMMTKGNTVSGSTDFRLIDRKVVDQFNAMTEHGRITRGLIDWMGYRRTYVKFNSPARQNGEAGYSINKLVKLAMNGFVSQSTAPLLFTGALGLFVIVASLAVGGFMVTEQYILGDPLNLQITGTAILAVFLSLLIGVVLGCQGLLALYIESIHNETQNRPLYIISEEG